jgi:lipoprotein-releasing system permease protein
VNFQSTKAALLIAWRYLFSKKKHNVINIISIISAIGIIVSSAALVIVLSVFNGMEGLVRNSFNRFNPDIEITAKEGKVIELDSFPLAQLKQLPNLKSLHEVVSDLTLVNYGECQVLTNFKGVSADYPAETGLEHLIYDGEFALGTESQPAAVLGATVAGMLRLNLNGLEMIELYYPKRLKKNLTLSTEAFNRQYLKPSGVFLTNTEYDKDYLFIPIEIAKQLCDYDHQATSVELYLYSDVAPLKEVQKSVESIVGEKYVVKNQYQQEEDLFRTMKSEKLIIFFILTLIIIMATFNIIGVIGMMIVEKKKDISVLYTLGANRSFIKQIFLFEGAFVSFIGGILGILLGFIICLLQQYLHLVKLGDGSEGFIIDYYPVAMQGEDFFLVFLAVIIVTLFASMASLLGLQKGNKSLRRLED